MKTTLVLPAPPSVNMLYSNVANRGRVKTKKYRTWLREAGLSIAQAKPVSILGKYRLHIRFERPDNRRRDLGNLLKAIEDILVEHGIVEDDSHAQEILMVWQGRGSLCTVEISSFAEAPE